MHQVVMYLSSVNTVAGAVVDSHHIPLCILNFNCIYKSNIIYLLIQEEYYYSFKVSSCSPEIKLIYLAKVKKKSDNLLIYL